jgi:hypothetical protein
MPSGPWPTPTPGALEDFLTHTVEAQVTDAALPLVTAAPAEALARTTELKRSLRSNGAILLDRALQAGAVRPDLAAADMVPLMCGIAHAVAVHGGTPADRIDTARRTPGKPHTFVYTDRDHHATQRRRPLECSNRWSPPRRLLLMNALRIRRARLFRCQPIGRRLGVQAARTSPSFGMVAERAAEVERQFRQGTPHGPTDRVHQG